MPEQKARSPVPVRTTARTSGSDSASRMAVPERVDQARRQGVAGLGPVEPEERERALALAHQLGVGPAHDR